MWEFDGSKWVKRFSVPSSGSLSVLLNEGLWLVNHNGSVAYFRDGTYTDIPGLPAPESGYLLRDGTILLSSGTDTFLGSGEGMRRQWVRLTR